MFGISGEHLLILGIILLFFGPRRLPELGNTLGKALRNFKDAIGGVEEAKFRHINDSAQTGAQQPTDKPPQAAAEKPPATPTPDIEIPTPPKSDTGTGPKSA